MKTYRPNPWDRQRSTHWLIGLVLSLSFVVFAFRWTAEGESYENLVVSDLQAEEIPVVRTKHEDPVQLPPPKPMASAEPSDANPDFIEEPQPDTLSSVIRDPVSAEPNRPAPAISPPKTPPVLIVKPVAEEAPVIFAEVMPRFPGCEEGEMTSAERQACAESQLLTFIGSRLKYPEIAQQNGIEGTVVIRFVVEKDGSITNAEIARDIGGSCGRAALEVVEKMPRWIPGRQQGHKVRVRFNLPVRFSLKQGF